MDIRSAIRMSGLLLVLGAVGCTEDGYKTTDLSTRFIVEPAFIGIEPPSPPVQYTARIAGADVPVTWASSNIAVATVNATGLVTIIDYGFSAITATMTSDPTQLKSASLNVKPAGITMAHGVAKTGIGGAIGAYILYHILVPAGTTNLRIAMSGGTGDLDLHVRAGVPPTLTTFTCRPYLGGNNETCNIANPTPGFYFALLDVYDTAAGASLVATLTPAP